MPEDTSSLQTPLGTDNAGHGATLSWTTLANFGLLEFTGEDAQAFLHGQLSCDVNALQVGRASYGSYNTPKGRMLATFLLWRDDNGYLMQLPRSICESTRRRLSMYILRSKVKARDVSDERTLIGVAGAATATLLTALVQTLPTEALALTRITGA